MQRPITLWYCYDKESKEYSYNHYEEGHVTTLSPAIKVPNNIQSKWPNHKWIKEYRSMFRLETSDGRIDIMSAPIYPNFNLLGVWI